MPISDEDIQWLLSIAESENLAEIEVHVGEDETLVKRYDATIVAAAPGALAAPEIGAAASDAPLPENVVPITAPMSGVFYRAASPESPPYVEIGQQVEEEDTVGLIEAMKLFNDVHSPVSGAVFKILVENEELVEPGQALMLIET